MKKGGPIKSIGPPCKCQDQIHLRGVEVRSLRLSRRIRNLRRVRSNTVVGSKP